MIPISDDNPASSRPPGPARRRPVVTVTVIALCVLVFAWELSLGSRMDGALAALGFTPGTLLHPQSAVAPWLGIPPWTTIFTAMFLHAGWLHIGGNLLYLWIFGNNIEDAMGHAKYALFYLACGVAAALAMVLIDPASQTPIVGASGAISGVLGAYVLLYPRARVLTIIPLVFIFYPVRLRAVWVVGIWFALQLVAAALTPPSDPGVAWWAHVGGFVAGLALTPLLKSRAVPYFGPLDSRGPWGRG